MQPAYGTVPPLLVKVSERLGLSRDAPWNFDTAGCVWGCSVQTAPRRPASLLVPRQHWLFLTCAGSCVVNQCRQEEAAEARAAPELTRHPQREDQAERCCMSQPVPKASPLQLNITTTQRCLSAFVLPCLDGFCGSLHQSWEALTSAVEQVGRQQHGASTGTGLVSLWDLRSLFICYCLHSLSWRQINSLAAVGRRCCRQCS